MSEVLNYLTGDLTRDAANYPVAGMLQKILFIPGNELDPPANVTKSSDTLVTDIVPSAAGHVIEGIGDNQTMNFTQEGVEDDNGRNGYILGITGIHVLDPDQATRQLVHDAFVGSGVVYVVFEKKWAGTDRDDAFLFGGYTHGLVIKNYTWNGNENHGVMTFDLMTPNNRTEPFGWMNYLKTDYATTKADVWTSKLA